jgi:hypothetical protein
MLDEITATYEEMAREIRKREENIGRNLLKVVA